MSDHISSKEELPSKVEIKSGAILLRSFKATHVVFYDKQGNLLLRTKYEEDTPINLTEKLIDCKIEYMGQQDGSVIFNVY